MKSPIRKFRSQLIEWGALGFELGRGLHFLTQMRAMQGLTRLLVPGGFPTRMREKAIEKRLERGLLELFREDARLFGRGVFPLEMLLPENPLKHGLRVGNVLLDGLRLLRQKKQGRTAVFGPQAGDRLADKPRYYQRNFHFQSDGYLSKRSADLYEHQVELLFSGTADAMRRLALQPLVERWPDSDGQGLRILEIAAGTGRMSRFLKLLFPKAELTITELSEVYLKKARSKLAKFERVNFVQAQAEALPFRDGGFDAVVSVFLFHELPLEVRRQVLREHLRVAKPGGLLVAVDSIQLQDVPELSPVLEQFPIDFHEPFYRNYIENPLEQVFREAGVSEVRSATGFLSKRVWGTKS